MESTTDPLQAAADLESKLKARVDSLHELDHARGEFYQSLVNAMRNMPTVGQLGLVLCETDYNGTHIPADEIFFVEYDPLRVSTRGALVFHYQCERDLLKRMFGESDKVRSERLAEEIMNALPFMQHVEISINHFYDQERHIQHAWAKRER